MEKTKNPITVKQLCVAAIFTAITCVLAPISLPVGIIPFSLGVFAVLLVGAVLPPRLALLSIGAYMLLGLVGLPVFSGYRTGLQVLAGPTGGFAITFPVMSWLVSLFSHKPRKALWLYMFCSMVVAIAICHTGGVIWYSLYAKVTLAEAFAVCSAPFILVDLAKAVLATAIGLVIRRILIRLNIQL
ncbi:MAG: biotin transporter BioY [Christensenellales bacterium]|jgi:biotin transport system substrate-specific component